jgi:hypothetical protein
MEKLMDTDKTLTGKCTWATAWIWKLDVDMDRYTDMDMEVKTV